MAPAIDAMRMSEELADIISDPARKAAAETSATAAAAAAVDAAAAPSPPERATASLGEDEAFGCPECFERSSNRCCSCCCIWASVK